MSKKLYSEFIAVTGGSIGEGGGLNLSGEGTNKDLERLGRETIQAFKQAQTPQEFLAVGKQLQAIHAKFREAFFEGGQNPINKPEEIAILSSPTPLHAFFDQPKTFTESIAGMQFLEGLLKHCDVNQKNALGETPLQVAVKEGNPDQIEMIAKKNPRLGINDKGPDGLTPLETALRSGKQDNVTEILVQGAKTTNYKRSMWTGFKDLVKTGKLEKPPRTIAQIAQETGKSINTVLGEVTNRLVEDVRKISKTATDELKVAIEKAKAQQEKEDLDLKSRLAPKEGVDEIDSILSQMDKELGNAPKEPKEIDEVDRILAQMEKEMPKTPKSEAPNPNVDTSNSEDFIKYLENIGKELEEGFKAIEPKPIEPKPSVESTSSKEFENDMEKYFAELEEMLGTDEKPKQPTVSTSTSPPLSEETKPPKPPRKPLPPLPQKVEPVDSSQLQKTLHDTAQKLEKEKGEVEQVDPGNLVKKDNVKDMVRRYETQNQQKPPLKPLPKTPEQGQTQVVSPKDTKPK